LSTFTAPLSFPDKRSRRGLIALGSGFLGCFLLLACLASSARADDRVYWANDGPNDAGRISFADLDNSGGGDLITTGPEPGHARGLAMDVAAGRVYFTLPGDSLPGEVPNGQIVYASLDNTGGGGRLNTGTTKNHPNGAAVYPAAGKIYWANEDGNSISFANLDGSAPGDLILEPDTTVRGPLTPMVAPGLGPAPGRIYWANVGADLDGDTFDSISYANLNGSGSGDVDPGVATVANPHGVAFDPETNRIYWANFGTLPGNEGQGISYVNLDNPRDAGNLDVTVNGPIGVAIDPDARRIYWANHYGTTISWANLDGPGGGNVSTNIEPLDGPRSPVLLKAPIGNGAPAITGGSSAGSVLTCSQGSWASDELASWLYRAPQRFSYSWTRNGAPIPGASGNTHVPSADGDYRCTVTASNPAGSSSQTSAPRAASAPPPPPAGSPPAGSPSQPSQPPAGPPSGGGSSKPTKTVANPAFGAKTLVKMSVAARRIRGSGPIKVVIRNANGFQVSGRLSAQTSKRVSASRTRTFVVGSKGKATVTLRLSKSMRQLLKRKGKLSLRLTATVKDPAGGTRTVKKTVSLRLKTA
jgi:hypothetical protein